MDERRQPPGYDTARKPSADRGDAPVYIFALVATIVLVSGLFVWLRLDPVPPPNPPATQSSSVPDFP